MKYVHRFDDFATYSPPLHGGTVNRRLVPPDVGAGFEMIHGTLEPGGSAQRHYHPTEWQVIFLLSGEGLCTVADGKAEHVGPGTVIHLPPGTPHSFHVIGERSAEVLVIYAPPLGPASFQPDS
jgi:quercetin dioxygenase-like cupin family protein